MRVGRPALWKPASLSTPRMIAHKRRICYGLKKPLLWRLVRQSYRATKPGADTLNAIVSIPTTPCVCQQSLSDGNSGHLKWVPYPFQMSDAIALIKSRVFACILPIFC